MKTKIKLVALIILALISTAKAEETLVEPTITPLTPPVTFSTQEVLQETPPTPEVNVVKEDKGIFGWKRNGTLGGSFLLGNGAYLGGRGDITLSDPWKLGEKIGLAEDAVEYKVGAGLGLGSGFMAFPLFADAVVYFKEKAFYGWDSFAGAGLILNLAGGLGGQIYFGILLDSDHKDESPTLSFGLASYAGSSAFASGLQVAFSKPVRW